MPHHRIQPRRRAVAMVGLISAFAGYWLAAQPAPAAPPAARAPELPALSVEGATVAEGDAGTTPATFVVTLTPRSKQPVTVEYSTRDGSATAKSGDYRGTRGRIELPPGIDSATVDVEVYGDTAEEADETFSLVLSRPAGAELRVAEAQAEIVDDDGAAGPGAGAELSIADGKVSEGNAGRRTVTLAVTLSAASPKPVTVDYATLDGSAHAAEDYEERTGKLRFAPGVTTRTVEVTVLGDGAVEGDEDLVVGLANPVGAVLGHATAHAVILDDDERGTLTVEAVGPRERRARPGQMLMLEVRARHAGGEPASGTAVQWSVDGEGELLDGATTTSDGRGIATQRLRLGANSGSLAVRAVAAEAEQPVLIQVTVAQPPG